MPLGQGIGGMWSAVRGRLVGGWGEALARPAVPRQRIRSRSEREQAQEGALPPALEAIFAHQEQRRAAHPEGSGPSGT